jgi:filamentous hemagglutinin
VPREKTSQKTLTVEKRNADCINDTNCDLFALDREDGRKANDAYHNRQQALLTIENGKRLDQNSEFEQLIAERKRVANAASTVASAVAITAIVVDAIVTPDATDAVCIVGGPAACVSNKVNKTRKALDAIDDIKRLPKPKLAAEWRNSPGRSFSSRGLKEIKDGDKWLRGSHGNAGTVPKQVADKLSGQQFNNFSEFREAFWKEVSKDPALIKKFGPDSIREMKAGRAPFAHSTQHAGKRIKYELDHNQEIQDGGGVYDLSNIIIRTPLNHMQGK